MTLSQLLRNYWTKITLFGSLYKFGIFSNQNVQDKKEMVPNILEEIFQNRVLPYKFRTN